MNRSSRGFGLAGVLATVIFLAVAAAMSTPASATTHIAQGTEPVLCSLQPVQEG